MGKEFKGKFVGVLIVLLALSSARASDTSFHSQSFQSQEIKAKKETVVVVSVLDSMAFSKNDIQSLTSFVHRKLPKHNIIHITAFTSVRFSNIPQLHEIKNVHKAIKQQMKAKITPDMKISHLILMDHGNTSLDQDPKTLFKFLGDFGRDGVDPIFKQLFDPLVGKFSDNAFVFLEACATTCDGFTSAQDRIEELMRYFKIPRGTVFGAYQNMISVGFEWGYHLREIGIQMRHPIYLGAAILLGFAGQLDTPFTDATFSLTEVFLSTLVVDVALPVLLKIKAFISKTSQSVNWGYLFKFDRGFVKKVFELNPYENKNELFLRMEPKRFKAEVYTCSSFFL